MSAILEKTKVIQVNRVLNAVDTESFIIQKVLIFAKSVDGASN